MRRTGRGAAGTLVAVAAVTAVAAGLAAGAAGVRRGWRPALPGTSEPRLAPLDAADRAWLDRIRAMVDPAALRATVEAFPGPRNRFDAPEAMRGAEDAIVRALEEAGWPVARRPYAFEDTPPGGYCGWSRVPAYARVDGVNLVAIREGTESRDAVVVLAHYDTVAGTIGADDNTASVAALLALARVLAPERFRHTVILALPDMEEAGLFGAYALARELTAERRLHGVICLETMAFTSREPGIQSFPDGADLLFPRQVARLRAQASRGEFTMVAYDGVATGLAARFAEGLASLAGPEAVMLFRAPADLPGTGAVLRRLLPGVRNFSRSDHLAFWQAGVPAILVTDTANFRYAHYHEPTDTPEKLDYERLAAITTATAGAVARTAGLAPPASADDR